MSARQRSGWGTGCGRRGGGGFPEEGKQLGCPPRPEAGAPGSSGGRLVAAPLSGTCCQRPTDSSQAPWVGAAGSRSPLSLRWALQAPVGAPEGCNGPRQMEKLPQPAWVGGAGEPEQERGAAALWGKFGDLGDWSGCHRGLEKTECRKPTWAAELILFSWRSESLGWPLIAPKGLGPWHRGGGVLEPEGVMLMVPQGQSLPGQQRPPQCSGW